MLTERLFHHTKESVYPIAYGAGEGGIFMSHHQIISCHSETI